MVGELDDCFERVVAMRACHVLLQKLLVFFLVDIGFLASTYACQYAGRRAIQARFTPHTSTTKTYHGKPSRRNVGFKPREHLVNVQKEAESGVERIEVFLVLHVLAAELVRYDMQVQVPSVPPQHGYIKSHGQGGRKRKTTHT